MTPEPNITISWDYLVELSDDGTRLDQAEPETIVLPPTPNGSDPSSASANPPEVGPQH